MKLLAILWSFGLIQSGCFTPGKEKQLNADIYNLQQRTFQLEKKLGDNSNAKTTQKKIASTTTTVEKLEMEIQKLKGELDTMRVGIRTGQIPGEEVEEGTLRYTIDDMLTRIEAIEEAQSELLAVIRGEKKKKSSKKNSGSLSSVSDLQKAFDRKKYPKVIEAAAGVAKKTKKKSDKNTVAFLHAESLYKVGKLRDAALKFNDLIDAKPNKSIMAKSKLRMGDCFRHLGDSATSRVYYSELIAEFPESDQAEVAQKRLEKLKKNG